MKIGLFHFSGEELCRYGDVGDPNTDNAHWCLWEEVDPVIAAKDAEITRLRAELERVRGQRDKALINHYAHERIFVGDAQANVNFEKEYGLRVVGGTVEEIEK